MPPIPRLRFWNASIMFDHEINWKGLCLVLSDWVTWFFLLERFCKSFIFLVMLLLKQEIFKRDFYEISFLILRFQSLGTMTQFLFKSRVGSETRFKKLKETSYYGKFICNMFSWDTAKIGIIISLLCGLKMMGCSRISSICVGIVSLLLVKCRLGLSNCINNSPCFVSVSFYV